MKILFPGAGAIGARFGFLLKQSGNEVVFADNWQEHIDKINNEGLSVIIDGEDLDKFKIPSFKPNEVEGKFDLVFVFTKAMHLNQMMQDIKHVIKKDTYVICLLNGLGNIDNITPYVPREQIYLGTTVWSSGLGGPGILNAVGSGSINLQQVEHTDTPFHQKMLDTLNKAGLNVQFSDNVEQTIWYKVELNCVLNTYCTLIDCDIAEYGDYKYNEV